MSLPLCGAGRPVSPENSPENAAPACQERGRSLLRPHPHEHRSLEMCEPHLRSPTRHDPRHCSPQSSPRQRSPRQQSPRPSPARQGRGSPARRWEGDRREPSPPRPHLAGSGGRRGRRNGSERGRNGRGQNSAVDRAVNMVTAAVRHAQVGGEAADVHVSVTTDPPVAPVVAAAAPLHAPTLREYLPAARGRAPFRVPRQTPGYSPPQMAAFPPCEAKTAPPPIRAGRDPMLSMSQMWNLAEVAEGVANLQMAVYEAMRNTPSSFDQGPQGQCVAGAAPLARTFPRHVLDLQWADRGGTPVETLRYSAQLLLVIAACLRSMLEAEGAGPYTL
ncbi:unnamed protein product [Closterium sp. NIES-53]